MSLPARLAIRGTIDHMRWILRLLANAAALAIATWILSGITLTGPSTASQILTPVGRGVDLRSAQRDHQADLRSLHRYRSYCSLLACS